MNTDYEVLVILLDSCEPVKKISMLRSKAFALGIVRYNENLYSYMIYDHDAKQVLYSRMNKITDI